MLALAVGPTRAEADASSPASVDWQKQNLVDRLRGHVERSLSRVLEDGEYSVEVEVRTKPFDAKLSGGANPSRGETPTENRPLGGSVRVADILPDKDAEEYFLFSKLGLVAPLPGSAALESSAGAMNATAPPPVNPLEVVQKTNLFGYLESVEITVLLDKSLAEPRKAQVQSLLDGMKFNLGGAIKPRFRIESVDLSSPRQRPEEPGWKNELMLTLARLPMTLLPALFLGGLLFMGLKLAAGRKSDAPAAAPPAPAPMPALPPPPPPAPTPTLVEAPRAAGADTAPSELGEVGTRFENYHKNFPKRSLLLVKVWLSEGTAEAQARLRYLASAVSEAVLRELIQGLSDQERSVWQEALEGENSADERRRAAEDVRRGIVTDLVVPDIGLDDEARELLLRVRPEAVAAWVAEDADFGAFFVNVLSVHATSRFLSACSDDQMPAIIRSGVALDVSRLAELAERFKAKAKDLERQSQPPPFARSLERLLEVADPKREVYVLEALARTADPDRFAEVTLRRFPAFLLERLKNESFDVLLKTLPTAAKARLIVSLGEAPLGTRLNGLVAAPGTKLREMLDIELEGLRRNPPKPEENEEVWKSFAENARKLLPSAPPVAQDAREVVLAWREECLGATASTNSDSSSGGDGGGDEGSPPPDNVHELKAA